ncbi:MAG: response regulator [Campylobacterota bacterium]
MDSMEHIMKLKEIAKEYDILFVEDSIELQAQVNKFLKKLFRNVYVACDGYQGLQMYKKHTPKLILTDLTMPKMSGHEMIREIKKINPDIEIVILSAHSDSDTLMKSFHIGVTDFISKPVNAPKMIATFLKVLSNLKRKESNQNRKDFNKMKSNEDILKVHLENEITLDIINHYKKVPIINEGHIKKIEDNEITIKTTYAQLLAIKDENITILDSSLVNENIKCELIEINYNSYEAKLKKVDTFFPEVKDKNELVVEPDNKTKGYITLKKGEHEVTLKAISQKEIIINIQKEDFEFEKHDKVNFKIVFTNDSTEHKPIYTIQLDATIFKIDESSNKGVDLVLLIKENDKIKKFTYTRETQIIEEFKRKFLD